MGRTVLDHSNGLACVLIGRTGPIGLAGRIAPRLDRFGREYPVADVDGGHQGERELDVGRQAAWGVREDVEGVRGAPAGEGTGAQFGYFCGKLDIIMYLLVFVWLELCIC